MRGRQEAKQAVTKSVLIAVRVHPFPSRTRQLSSLAPKILGWRRPGKIGSADTISGQSKDCPLISFCICMRFVSKHEIFILQMIERDGQGFGRDPLQGIVAEAPAGATGSYDAFFPTNYPVLIQRRAPLAVYAMWLDIFFKQHDHPSIPDGERLRRMLRSPL